MAPELLRWLCALFPVFGKQKLSFIRRLFALFLVLGEQKVSFIQRLFALCLNCALFGGYLHCFLCLVNRNWGGYYVFGI